MEECATKENTNDQVNSCSHCQYATSNVHAFRNHMSKHTGNFFIDIGNANANLQPFMILKPISKFTRSQSQLGATSVNLLHLIQFL